MPTPSKIVRYSKFPFPKRKYIPGEGIHPRKDPSGNHIPKLSQGAIQNAGNWQTCERYLYAVDLFNFGYWWEAHEVLEGLWMSAGRINETALFIQGIIQIAAALLKDSQGNKRGAESLYNKGLQKLRRRSGIFLGINVPKFIEDIEKYFNGEKSSPPLILLSLQ